MKPYYKDKFATVYNEPCRPIECDVVVLDPPFPISDVLTFKASVYIIFCGNRYDFYYQQLYQHVGNIGMVGWNFKLPNDSKIYHDTILMAGSKLRPGIGLYVIPPEHLRSHKWERPEALMLNLLTETSGLILDPFMGSGNALIAAKKLGRESIGFEIVEPLCKIAAERLSEI